jgi:hypothetical protein
VGNELLKPTLFDRRLWTCHIGYALAANSCERVAGVDACTAAALDAITAFAVPNLDGHLATPSIFSGLAVPRVASLTDRFGLLQVGSAFGAALFCRRRM